MQILIAICCLLASCYTVLMLLYRRGWFMQKVFKTAVDYTPGTSISIVMPARNEAANIGNCIRSILAQNYPRQLFEVIIIDDHSTDNTADIVRSFADERIHYVALADHIQQDEVITAYKKKALSIAIARSSGSLIVTTDADCTMQADWLKNIAAIYEADKPVMIVAPVDYACDNSILHLFQSIDFMSMQGITAAAHSLRLGNMSNGANLAFSKEAYRIVDGYTGIDHLASGDDYLLMMKLQRTYPGRISYLKSRDAIVSTAPQPGWQGFLQQRIRWASKSGKYDDKKLTAILILVYLFNCSFLILAIAATFAPYLWKLLLLLLALKLLIELYFLYPVATFFNKRRQLWYFPVLQPLHIIYIVIAGWLGFLGKYQWKGRTTT